VKEVVLRELACREGFAAVEELAELLGQPEEVVARALRELVEGGYPVERHPQLGYRFRGDDVADLACCAHVLGERLRFTLHHVDRCSSTQDVARELAGEGAGEGLVVVAEEQERGRGRRGRSWASDRGGLWLSILLTPGAPALLGPLSLALGVAVAKAVRALYGLEARVKWPNDVEVGGRKVAGVLIEAASSPGSLLTVVAGIGVNVNNPLPEALRGKAASLRELLGRSLPRRPLLAKLLVEVDRVYTKLEADPQGVLEEWLLYSSTVGRAVRVVTEDGEYCGVAVGLAEDGGLVVDVSGEKRVFRVGEVVHLR
jgi:BirA family biotin operon repressor/biotin-[acetyl-CoA-carboxylase] ligase